MVIAQTQSTVGIETCATGSIDANIAGLATERMAPTLACLAAEPGRTIATVVCVEKIQNVGCSNLKACSNLNVIPYMNYHKSNFSLFI